MTAPRPALVLTLLIPALTLLSACGGGGGSAGSSTQSGTTRGRRNQASSAEQSTNWSGYGIVDGPLGFTSVQGTWVVPAIAASKKDTASSTWAGIGGGCTDPPTCATEDETLIQAGTEQDNSGGTPTYYAWWEAIPAPSVTASGSPLSSKTFDVAPGDSITVKIDGSDLVVWTIEIDNVRSGAPHWTFTTTVPYTAAGLTAEWIEESPLSAGTNGAGQESLSDFNRVLFTDLTADGANPNLTPSDQIVLVNGSGGVLAQPSPPEGSNNSFAVCFGAGACE